MVQFSGRFKAGAPKARYMAGVRQKGYFGADDKVVLASTGREAYDAGGGFHRGAATTHATRHTECAWTERAAQQHTQSASSPSSTARKTREEKELALAMRTPNAAREGAPHGRIIINETTRFRVRARRRPVARDRRD